ncbi:MAG: HAMP domain-containing histidine kinase [Clostridiales Family XIII bacterium]|nr:HAMP domain-containing histidine kinase [Clostridiales Family XIII bacterium]
MKKSDKTIVRLIAFLLCITLVCGAAVLVAIGNDRMNEIQAESRVPANDYFSLKPYLETDSFAFMLGDNALALSDLYYSTKALAEMKASPNENKTYDETLATIYSDMADQIGANFGPDFDAVFSDREFTGKWENTFAWDAQYVHNGADGRLIYTNNVEHDTVYFDMDLMLDDSAIVDTKKMNNELGNKINAKFPKKFKADGVRKAFESHYKEELSEVQASMIADYEKSCEQLANQLNSLGADYFIGDGKVAISNVKLGSDNYPADTKALSAADVHMAYKGPDGETIVNGEPFDFTAADILGVTEGIPSNVTMYFSLGESALGNLSLDLHTGRAILREAYLPAAAMIVVVFVLFIILIFWTGRKRADGSRKIYALDNIFPEVQLGLAILVGLGGVATAVHIYQEILRLGGAVKNIGYFVLLIFIVCLTASLVLWLLLSLVRQIKSGLIVKRSLLRLLICKPIKALALVIKAGFDGRNPYGKTIVLVSSVIWLSAIVGIGIYSSAVFVLILLAILALANIFTYKQVKRYGELRKGVGEIASGNLGYQIPVSGDAANEFDKLSLMVNEIGSAQNAAIQNELKNQRLKTDLISNVSHDLKTPLTSIITYTDLLKNEGLAGPHAEEYLAVIDEKGRRLQKLTEDLFDAAKASSGAITVRKEKVDLLALVKQEIAEMAEGFEEASLELIVDGKEEHYYVSADSQLLWRVADNLLSNVRKYALPGSRVYIDLKEKQPPTGLGLVNSPLVTTLEIKNVSAEKLNIPADELMERFKRGDSSRTTEGSGLGLAIAKDLTRLQGGAFEVVIDGDLFKTVTTLEPYFEE